MGIPSGVTNATKTGFYLILLVMGLTVMYVCSAQALCECCASCLDSERRLARFVLVGRN